ncbi:B3 domain-containing protein At1g05920-like [Solanum pennellii]|uniref:B3 domain-containing protein At1g05920-like n=1 Tax=Solanum pennellii TaxID=28526 RepID=A0ABM1HDV4_SOLPN|nr:B3 domain-containing protein At1g05920-like [Solanum pennellii]
MYRESRYRQCTSTLIVGEFIDRVPNMINPEPIEKFQDFEVSVIPKIDSLSVITEPIEKIQDFEVPVIPKIEKPEKKRRKNRVSEAVMPDELKKKIEELGVSISKVSLVIEKQLYKTDLSETHMRLSIPVNQVVNYDEFLNAQEKGILDSRDSCNRISTIKFNLIEPSLEICNINLTKWPMKSSYIYVLLNDWMSVHQRNGLKVNMMVQLWFFRKDEDPWLALVVPHD